VVMTGPSAAAVGALATAAPLRALRAQTSAASPQRTRAGSVAPVARPGHPSPLEEAL
jgi:hypothetical protein